MTDLADKRVGIIGTGATAVQCIPPLARDAAGALRLPAHAVVDRRAQQPPDRPRLVRDARAGLAARWLMNFATLQTGGFADEDL